MLSDRVRFSTLFQMCWKEGASFVAASVRKLTACWATGVEFLTEWLAECEKERGGGEWGGDLDWKAMYPLHSGNILCRQRIRATNTVRKKEELYTEKNIKCAVCNVARGFMFFFQIPTFWNAFFNLPFLLCHITAGRFSNFLSGAVTGC